MGSLYNKLVEYSKDNYYPMHMPGHKRNQKIQKMMNPYEIDITEIEGFDNLHDPEDILKEAMNRAAKIYGSEHTYFLINGSTVGILAAISACTKKGDTILVARNCHKSVYNAIYLNELQPVYIYPQIQQDYGINGGISPEKIEEMLIKYKKIKAIVVTSPTYEGIVSDIGSIAKIAHQYKIPLIVDEAHGAHLGFHKSFPKSSIERGADVVIHSVHKTLPALTQTALLHVNGNIVDTREITRYLGIYESSSPSYVLMASIDQCMELLDESSNELFSKYAEQLVDFHQSLCLSKIKLINKKIIGDCDIYDLDTSKIVISVKDTNITGEELYNILLKKYKIQMEMVSKDYVIAMTSICDQKEGYLRLALALQEIDQNIVLLKEGNDTCNSRNSGINGDNGNNDNNENRKRRPLETTKLKRKYTVYEAETYPAESVLLEDSIGRVSGEYAYLYPPGIPIIVPGEVIDEAIIEKLYEYNKSGLTIKGLQYRGLDKIVVLKEDI